MRRPAVVIAMCALALTVLPGCFMYKGGSALVGILFVLSALGTLAMAFLSKFLK